MRIANNMQVPVASTPKPISVKKQINVQKPIIAPLVKKPVAAPVVSFLPLLTFLTSVKMCDVLHIEENIQQYQTYH